MIAHPHALLSAHADDALDPEEIALLLEHLDGCPDCRLEFNELKAMKAWFATAPRSPLPGTLSGPWTHVAWSERWAAFVRSLWDSPPRWVSAGATTAFVILAATFLWWQQGRLSDSRGPLRWEPLLVAHAAASGDGLVPAGDFYAADSSALLASYHEDR